MFKIKATLPLPLLLILFAACGNQSSQRMGSDHYVYTPANYQSLQSELERASLTCMPDQDCPENVGLILANFGDESAPALKQCTGSFVSKNVVATNSHCIPDSLKKAGSTQDCSQLLGIKVLRKDQNVKPFFQCRRLLAHEKSGALSPDYAFFEVQDAEAIAPIPVDRSGIHHHQKIMTIQVTPLHLSDEHASGLIETKSCPIVMSSLLNIISVTQWAKTGVAVGCTAVHGNSGSPVLNEAGSVIGILQSEIDADEHRKLMKKIFEQYLLPLPSRFKPHFIFTHLACVPDPMTGEPAKTECKEHEKLNISHCGLVDVLGNNDPKMNEIDQTWRKSLPNTFIYRWIFSLGTKATSADPLCVKSEAVGRKKTLDFIFPKSMSQKFQFSYDEEYRFNPTLKVEPPSQFEYRIALNRQKNKKSTFWEGESHSTYSSLLLGIDLTQMKTPHTLPLCSKEQLEAPPINLVQLTDGKLITEEEYRKANPPMQKHPACD